MAMRCTKEGSVDPYLGELELSVWYDAELPVMLVGVRQSEFGFYPTYFLHPV